VLESVPKRKTFEKKKAPTFYERGRHIDEAKNNGTLAYIE